MSPTARDVVLGVTAILAFPLAINLTAVSSSGDGRSLDDPIFQRGEEPSLTTARK